MSRRIDLDDGAHIPDELGELLACSREELAAAVLGLQAELAGMHKTIADQTDSYVKSLLKTQEDHRTEVRQIMDMMEERYQHLATMCKPYLDQLANEAAERRRAYEQKMMRNLSVGILAEPNRERKYRAKPTDSNPGNPRRFNPKHDQHAYRRGR